MLKSCGIILLYESGINPMVETHHYNILPSSDNFFIEGKFDDTCNSLNKNKKGEEKTMEKKSTRSTLCTLYYTQYLYSTSTTMLLFAVQ